MIDLYTWKTPNGYKVAIMLEECQIPYKIIPVDISKNAQYDQEFLKISPSNKIPIIVDHDNESMAIFESGAILIYLAEKTGKFLPADLKLKTQVIQWLMFQMSGVGPIFGQLFHFKKSAKENIPYAIQRYTKETIRLLNVIEKQLTNNDYIADAYSIADMAIYPWITGMKKVLSTEMDNMPNITKWFNLIGDREAVKRAMNIVI